MARPTFSKVLYTQQLGRGLRNYPGKEALYVLDVVDNYGAKLQPMSLHAQFKIPSYQPFADMIEPLHISKNEITILDGLYEGERRIEPVNILTFVEEYGTFLNEEQLARKLFISTGTVRQWLRKGKISSDVQYPFGRRQLHYFDPKQVSEIREKEGLKEHTSKTRVADFLEFIEKRDYTFSYKIIFILGFLKIRNERFEVKLPDLLDLYQRFYRGILSKYRKNERIKSPYNQREYIEDTKTLQVNMMSNPFEKFERKRFFYHCKDLNYLAMDPELINNLTEANYQKIIDQLVADLNDYYMNLHIELSEFDYSFILPDEKKEALITLFTEEPSEEEKFITALPYYPLEVAAGMFKETAVPTDPDSWFKVEGLTRRRKLSESMFVSKVHGKSMEPNISDGSYCIFSRDVGGSRNGRIVLVEKDGFVDPDTGFSYTVKFYQSTKSEDPDHGWHHDKIVLKPANPDYEEITVPQDESEEFKVIAFFIEVLKKTIN